MIKRATIRDILISVIMLGAFAFVQFSPVDKSLAEKKIQLSTYIPVEFPFYAIRWKSSTYDTSDYSDKWQSINELLVRKYYQRNRVNVNFILEYSSDMRRNFSFHFPEVCHRSGGNKVDFLDPLEIDLGRGRILKTKLLFIKGVRGSIEEDDKLVAYWLVIDKKQYYQTFWIKIDQMLSGLLKQSKSGFLVRVDFSDGVEYSPEGMKKGKTIIKQFVRDFYNELEHDQRKLLFGEI